jgi:uridylate kinase
MSQPRAGLRYNRLLLKLSGEALMGKNAYGIDMSVCMRLARDIKEAVDAGV